MLAVTLAALGYLGNDLIALVKLEPARVLKAQRRLAKRIGNYLQLAELVDYLAHKARVILFSDLRYLALERLSPALEGAHHYDVTRQRAEQELARNEKLLACFDVLNKAECAVYAHDLAPALFLFLAQAEAVLCFGYLAAALHCRNGVVELIYVKMLALAVTQKLLVAHGLFAAAFELADNKLCVIYFHLFSFMPNFLKTLLPPHRQAPPFRCLWDDRKCAQARSSRAR